GVLAEIGTGAAGTAPRRRPGADAPQARGERPEAPLRGGKGRTGARERRHQSARRREPDRLQRGEDRSGAVRFAVPLRAAERRVRAGVVGTARLVAAHETGTRYKAHRHEAVDRGPAAAARLRAR